MTLDGAFVLLHLPIIGQFCPNKALEFNATLECMMDLLGIERMSVSSKLMQWRGPHVRLS